MTVSRLFGRHIERAADADAVLTDGRRMRNPDGEQLRQPEIDYLDDRAAESGEDHGPSGGSGPWKEKVGRLDVAMHDAVFVGEMQGAGDLDMTVQTKGIGKGLCRATNCSRFRPSTYSMANHRKCRRSGWRRKLRRCWGEPFVSSPTLLGGRGCGRSDSCALRRDGFHGRHPVHHAVHSLVHLAEAAFPQLVKDAILAKHQPADLPLLMRLSW